jgi:hypothetical protein
VKFLFHSIFFLIPLSGIVQPPGTVGGNWIFGGTAYSDRQANVFSFLSNQAALAQLNNVSVGLYSERKFFQAELNSHLVAACVPMSPGNFKQIWDFNSIILPYRSPYMAIPPPSVLKQGRSFTFPKNFIQGFI